MPALVDGDYTLADSSAILHYLEAKFPEPALIPADPKLRGKTIWFDEFADTILFACGAKMFFNRVVAPLFLKRPGDLEAADKAQHEELPPVLDYLESVVPDAGGFLVDGQITIADLAVASPFANLRHMGVDIDPQRHPRTRAYVEAILARPSFAGLIEGEAAMLSKAAAA
jgi:glutathione S-transferase